RRRRLPPKRTPPTWPLPTTSKTAPSSTSTDNSDYDQITVTEAIVGNAAHFMLEITYTEPGLQGDRSTGGTKPATVETGHHIQVPLFTEQGTKVKVDTRTGQYLSRVN
ncbi:hypothetical protein C5D15_00995, partial [Rathayibacter toxicus]